MSKNNKRKKGKGKAAIRHSPKPGDPKIGENSEAESKKSLARRILSVVWKVVAGASVVAGIWAVVTPRVFVYPSVALDPANPVFTLFVVRNEGYLAVRDVRFSCSMRYLKFAGGIYAVGLGDYTNRFSDPKQVARVIAPGEEYSQLLPISGLQHNQIEGADIAIVLSFRPVRWLPLRRERLHRFVVSTGTDGQRHWVHQPISR